MISGPILHRNPSRAPPHQYINIKHTKITLIPETCGSFSSIITPCPTVLLGFNSRGTGCLMLYVILLVCWAGVLNYCVVLRVYMLSGAPDYSSRQVFELGGCHDILPILPTSSCFWVSHFPFGRYFLLLKITSLFWVQSVFCIKCPLEQWQSVRGTYQSSNHDY